MKFLESTNLLDMFEGGKESGRRVYGKKISREVRIVANTLLGQSLLSRRWHISSSHLLTPPPPFFFLATFQALAMDTLREELCEAKAVRAQTAFQHATVVTASRQRDRDILRMLHTSKPSKNMVAQLAKYVKDTSLRFMSEVDKGVDGFCT